MKREDVTPHYHIFHTWNKFASTRNRTRVSIEMPLRSHHQDKNWYGIICIATTVDHRVRWRLVIAPSILAGASPWFRQSATLASLNHAEDLARQGYDDVVVNCTHEPHQRKRTRTNPSSTSPETRQYSWVYARWEMEILSPPPHGTDPWPEAEANRDWITCGG
jgi:hypothetical protein